MSQINAKIVADSIAPNGCRITTMLVTMPRFILAEFNTHRMFSRNSASSRAIPFRKMLKMVQENPFIPIAWQVDHKGMQGNEYITDPLAINGCIEAWLQYRDSCVLSAQVLRAEDNTDVKPLTKQLCNRTLENFMYHQVLVTATEWENFFALRCPEYFFENKTFRSKKDYITYWENQHEMGFPDKLTDLQWLQMNRGQAEIHMMALAESMWDAYNESKPNELKEGEWHIPFGDNINQEDLENVIGYIMDGSEASEEEFKERVEDSKIEISVARCARLSYQTLGDNPKIDYEADIKLHDSLLESGHMSPFEHCARVMTQLEYYSHVNGVLQVAQENNGDILLHEHYPIYDGKVNDSKYINHNNYGWSGNFRGFIQYRKMIPNENIKVK